MANYVEYSREFAHKMNYKSKAPNIEDKRNLVEYFNDLEKATLDNCRSLPLSPYLIDTEFFVDKEGHCSLRDPRSSQVVEVFNVIIDIIDDYGVCSLMDLFFNPFGEYDWMPFSWSQIGWNKEDFKDFQIIVAREDGPHGWAILTIPNPKDI